MKHIHRQILRMLPGPLFGWLGLLMFLLLMQFLIKYLPDIVGKGLPFGVIVELIAYNLAYMVVLAVPMSVLIAALMTFGRLAETNSFMVIKSAGISLGQLIWPALVAGLMMTGGMWYFNNDVLPEANFRARNLWQDIQRKRPDFELQPGVFYTGLSGYSILVQGTNPDTKRLQDVLVYDVTKSSQRQTTIKAREGWIEPVDEGSVMDLVLSEGEAHRVIPQYGATGGEKYERLGFDRFRLRLDLSDFNFERTDPNSGNRSDRTMRTSEMLYVVDSLHTEVEQEKLRMMQVSLDLLTDSLEGQSGLHDRTVLPIALHADSLTEGEIAELDSTQLVDVRSQAKDLAELHQFNLEGHARTILWESQYIDRYMVEIHKKRSIALACVIFMLIGAPLGLSVGRGGLGVAGALAVGIFLFYWVTLVQGEKFADRGMLTPWVGMWVANLVMLLAGLWLVLYVTLDLRATTPLRKRFRFWLLDRFRARQRV